MSRPLRFIPGKKTLVEVTTRTVHSRLLLRPSNELNDLVLGILGRAQERYGAGVCGYVVLANHYHLLLIVDSAKQLSDFMGYFNSNLAREAGRLVKWREKFWARRYRAIVISGEPAAQRDRLKYVLSHGAKEGLVSSPLEWPGVHALRPLLEGTPVQGTWFDRTQEYAARRRGEEFERLRYATEYTVTLSPLPCWEDLPAEIQRRRIAEIAEEITAEAEARQKEKGILPMGADAIRRQHPHSTPMKTKRSYAPLFHAATKRVRDGLVEAYRAFVGAFREAAARLKAGDRDAMFPLGSFPPALPFVSG
jgi:REP element-mobilizing transposase RayT